MSIEDTLRAEWQANGPDAAPSWDAVVILMDADTCERIHRRMAPCTQRAFWSAYRLTADGRRLRDITQW